MKIQPGCRGCIEHQLKMLSRTIGDDEKAHAEALAELTAIYLKVADTASPPELAALYYAYLEERTGIRDPFRREKEFSTRLALRMLPDLKKFVGKGDGAFKRALLLAIGGNIIDYGANPDFNIENAERQIRQVMDCPCDARAVADLQHRMDAATRILYILDNCGEAVIDRLLIEPYADRITIAVRGKPILNDVTREDAAASGLDFVPVVDTGYGAPGVPLRHCSREFISTLNAADLVIAKGQGNFESMADEFTAAPAYYLLRTKCQVICQKLNAEMNSVRIIGRNLDRRTIHEE